MHQAYFSHHETFLNKETGVKCPSFFFFLLKSTSERRQAAVTPVWKRRRKGAVCVLMKRHVTDQLHNGLHPPRVPGDFQTACRPGNGQTVSVQQSFTAWRYKYIQRFGQSSPCRTPNKIARRVCPSVLKTNWDQMRWCQLILGDFTNLAER
jgi:hypothetical protein